MTMAQQQDVFEEHVGVIAALTENYARRDDALTVEHIHNVKAELNRLCDAREIDAKEIIKELTRRVESAERKATYPEPHEAHKGRVAELQGSTAAARAGVEELTKKLHDMQAQRNEIRDTLEELQKKHEKLERILQTEVPYVRHKISLYAAVSKINWDFGDMNRVAGFIKDPTCKFDLGSENGTLSVDSVNELWNLVDQHV